MEYQQSTVSAVYVSILTLIYSAAWISSSMPYSVEFVILIYVVFVLAAAHQFLVRST